MISMQDAEISPTIESTDNSGTKSHENPAYQGEDIIAMRERSNTGHVASNQVVPKHIGAVKLQPPDIDEDAGRRAPASYKKDVDLEKGKTTDNEAPPPPPTPESNGNENGTKPKKKFLCFPSKTEENKEPKKPTVGWIELFRYASPLDRVLMLIGSLAGLGHGAIMPTVVLVFGQIIDSFVLPAQLGDVGPCTPGFNMTEIIANMTAMGFKDPRESFIDKMGEQTTYLAIIGGVSFAVGYIQSACWNAAAENQVRRIRMAYFQSLLRQDVGWYDLQESGTVTSKFAEDINSIQKGIGDKVALLLQNVGAFIAGMVVGFYRGWKLSLVILSISPLLALAAILMVKFAFTQARQESSAYAKAGSIAQEVLSNIRTVHAFGGQQREVERYGSNLDEARKVGIKKGLLTGIMMGSVFFIIFGSYALGFSYGVKLINDKEEGYQIGTVTTTFFAIIMGTFSFGMSITSIQNLATARASAHPIYEIIDRIPPIDAFSKRGKKRENSEFSGRIEFKNISFAYPSRPDIPILRDVSITVEPGTTVAFVGTSGCGKSTLIQVLQRFYDPDSGSVLVDGDDLRDLNIFWFRSLIGSVSQEPILFGTTVYENIRYGYPDVTKEDIENAAKLANAYDFITKLPSGFQTLVGEQGAQLSGGQKQRIAIARALVRNPRILLLDEATSALDTESEAIVQDALDRARAGRTTIAVAHRLSTIMNADKIIVLDGGVVYETGTHGELIAKGGIYAKLVEAQQGREIVESELNFAKIKERRAALANKNKEKKDEPEKDKAKRKQSVAKPELTEREKRKQNEVLVKQHFSALRMWAMAKPEYPFFLLGLLGATVCGAVWPCFAIIFAKMLGAFTACTEEERNEKGMIYALVFLGIGGACFFGFIIMMGMSAIGGERLVARIRKMAFQAMLRQEIAWFDDDDNSTGALTSRLATQAGAVKDATGSSLAQMAQAGACLIAALIIGFIHEWRVTLIMLAFCPLVVFGGFIQGKAVGDTIKQDKFVEQAAKALVQSTTNIRTVTALGVYRIFIEFFSTPLINRNRREMIKIQIAALCFGLSEATIIFAYAAAFFAGAQFIRWGWTEFEPMYTSLAAIMFSAVSMGQANAMAPDQGKAQLAVAEIFKLVDRIPAIVWDSTEGKKPDSFSGSASATGVEFHYPSRPTAQILRGLNLQVQKGNTVALVGPSGCGKSTVIQLLERFYDPIKGEVSLDENPIPSLSLPWVRSKMSLVSQEPILFDRTIAENIIYGADGLTAENTSTLVESMQNEIIEAATNSNIHDFISKLPEGYNTRVGERGAQLSGGQKQRIAIARALIRKPQLLLLDEATSALDSESERIVQEALDKARTGRTVLVIAHRLSTIEGADIIAVVQDGVVRELGKHDELLALKGTYYGLWHAQQLTN